MVSSCPEVSDRIVIIDNPACSHADRVQDEVVRPIQALGLPVGQLVEFTVPSTDVSESIERLADVLQPGDRIISPAGDGTANLAVNAAMLAGNDGMRLGLLPYGNFDDTAATFTSRAAKRNPISLLTNPHVIEARPLQVLKDGEHHRYALLYANLGWTAQAAAMFDDPDIRRALQTGKTSMSSNLVRLAKSYYSQRSSAALPRFRRDGELEVHSSTTDILSVNGPIMGKIIRSARSYYSSGTFLSSELDVSTLYRNAHFLGRSALNLCLKTRFKLPGNEVSQLELDFGEHVAVPLQTDGNFELAEVRTIKIAKDESEDYVSVKIIAA